MRVTRTTAAKALWYLMRGVRRPGSPGAAARLRALPRMAMMSLTGRYPLLPRRQLALMIGAVVYILMPVDVIPELLLPVVGLADDALVLAWLVGAVLAETEAFLAWEAARARVVPGQVVSARADRPQD